MRELVHPHLAVRLLTLDQTEELSLIKAYYKDAKCRHAKQQDYCKLGRVIFWDSQLF
jgi:hypothetical protein